MERLFCCLAQCTAARWWMKTAHQKNRSNPFVQPDQRRSRYYGPRGWQLHLQMQRWPMVLWYNMIDVATLNAYSFFSAQHPEFYTGIINGRWHFLTELSKELVTPHKKSRLEGTPTLPTYITESMGRCGVTKTAAIWSQ